MNQRGASIGLKARRAIICVVACFCIVLSGCAAETKASQAPTTHELPQAQSAEKPVEAPLDTSSNGEIPKALQTTQITVTANEQNLSAHLVDNPSARALTELLADGPLTIAMHDYGNMEKVGPIGQTLPTSDEQITTEPGDIILYQGNQLTVYYDTNSWNFTRIGRIQDVNGPELREILGPGDVTVTFALA